jgi:archaellum component FlaC
MAEPSLDFIGRQLQSIQTELQQIKFAADVDRRNTASQYDNLVVAVGVKIGAFEAIVEQRLGGLREELNGMRDELNGMRDELNGMRDELNEVRGELLGRFDRIEQLLSKA